VFTDRGEFYYYIVYITSVVRYKNKLALKYIYM
jgi:hypothetical protein